MAYTGEPEGEDDDNKGEFQERSIPNPTPSNNDIIIDSKVFINDDPLSDTQILYHVLLRSSMRIKRAMQTIL